MNYETIHHWLRSIKFNESITIHLYTVNVTPVGCFIECGVNEDVDTGISVCTVV